MTDDSKSDDDQDNLFRKIMQNDKKFKPLDPKNKYFNTEKSNISKSKSQNNKSKISKTSKTSKLDQEQLILSDNLWRPIVSAQDYISYFKDGLQHKTILSLKQGKIKVEKTLDLHATTREQAAGLFQDFINTSYRQQLYCICIIHGKGIRGDQNEPILKNLVNHWLYEFTDSILGFCSCPPNLGGTGAVLVLLKRNN